MLRTVLHRGKDRGRIRLSWLDSYYSFSFADYYDPNKMNFGELRVLNSDVFSGGGGFPSHPHDNIEIITIPLEGFIEHKDSLGNTCTLGAGEIQVVSAGKGIEHSEMNADGVEHVRLLQLWIFPNKENVPPRYQKIAYDKDKSNEFQQIVSPNPDDAGAWIYQRAWLSLGTFDRRNYVTYPLYNSEGNGVYIFVIKGQVTIGGIKLAEQDALGVAGISAIEMTIDKMGTQLLLIEVPV